MGFLIPAAMTAMGASAATAATVGTIASVAGTAFSVLSGIQQGKAANATAKYNAAVADNNAQIATQNAAWRAQAGNAEAEAAQLKTRAKVGAILTNQAAAGVDVNSKSALDVRSSAAQMGELNAINIRSNAAREAYGYQTEAQNYKSQAALDRAQGKAAKTASYINAAGTVLGSVADPTQDWSAFNSKKSLSSGVGWVDWNDGGSTFYG